MPTALIQVLCFNNKSAWKRRRVQSGGWEVLEHSFKKKKKAGPYMLLLILANDGTIDRGPKEAHNIPCN